jgi:predicted dinucleotide-binding enzyme
MLGLGLALGLSALSLGGTAQAQGGAPDKAQGVTPDKAQGVTPGKEGAAPARIGIIGAGNIGGTIGSLWVKGGHAVMFSSRHPEELKGLVEGLGEGAKAGTPAEAIAFGEAVLIAVPYKAYPDLAKQYAEALKGRVVIDAGNATQARDGDLYTEVQTNGIGTTSAKYFPGARIVRAFNAANYKIFAKNAGRPAPRMAIPIAGDDEGALELAKRLISDAGFDPVVVGTLKDADAFAMGSAGFGHELSAPDLRAKLGLAP